MRRLWLLMAAVMLAGCAPGYRTQYFPKGGSLETSAEVTVMREAAYYASALTPKVVLDGWVIAELGVGEHVTFYVPPGMHSVGISSATQALHFKRGGKYYFVVSVDTMGMGFEVERLKPSQAARWLLGSRGI